MKQCSEPGDGDAVPNDCLKNERTHGRNALFRYKFIYFHDLKHIADNAQAEKKIETNPRRNIRRQASAIMNPVLIDAVRQRAGALDLFGAVWSAEQNEPNWTGDRDGRRHRIRRAAADGV